MNHAAWLLRARQRGISLYVVLIVVLLSMLLALWASRTALLNEMVVGSDADYQRAFETAQALIQDAELDIRHEMPDGSPCNSAQNAGDVCRLATAVHIPDQSDDVARVLTILSRQPTGCLKGLCLKRVGVQDFWNDHDARSATAFEKMTAADIGARYGQFTGMPARADDPERRNGWYWIEVLPYDQSSQYKGAVIVGGPTMANLGQSHAVFRITAIANGLKAGTEVVLQQTYVNYRLQD